MTEPSPPALPPGGDPHSSGETPAHAMVLVRAAESGELPGPAPRKASSITWLSVVAAAVACGAGITIAAMTAWPSSSAAPRPPSPIGANRRPVAVTPGPAVAAAPTVNAIDAAAPSKWTSRQQARWVGTGSRGIAFEVAAERPVAVWNGTATPVLVVRCVDKRTDVFVYTETAARIERDDDNHTVQLAFDGHADVDGRWPDSVEHDALFAPDGATTARRLVAAGTLRFRFEPHNAAPATAVFDVRGLAERLQPHAKKCGAAF